METAESETGMVTEEVETEVIVVMERTEVLVEKELLIHLNNAVGIDIQ